MLLAARPLMWGSGSEKELCGRLDGKLALVAPFDQCQHWPLDAAGSHEQVVDEEHGRRLDGVRFHLRSLLGRDVLNVNIPIGDVLAVEESTDARAAGAVWRTDETDLGDHFGEEGTVDAVHRIGHAHDDLAFCCEPIVNYKTKFYPGVAGIKLPSL